MQRVSGPHYVSIYDVNGCKVSLFGDIHFSKRGSCQDCDTDKDCMNIIQLYNNLQKPAQIFLEAPHYEKKSADFKDDVVSYYSLLNTKDWLGETIKHYKSYMYGAKHRKSSKVHVHYGDIRRHTSLDYMYLLRYVVKVESLQELDEDEIEVSKILLNDLRTKHHFKKLADAMVKSNDFKGDMTKLFGETAGIYADEEHLTTFPGVKTEVHRIRKQILKLSPKLQKAVVAYHNEQSYDILQDYHCYHYTKNRKKVLKRLDSAKDLAVGEAPLVIDVCIEKWLNHFIELYTLARMLYQIEKGGSKNVTMYMGAYHTYAVNYFFQNYMKGDAKHLWKYDSERPQLKKKTELRCVYIPKEMMQSITH